MQTPVSSRFALTVLLGLGPSLLLAGCGAVPTDQPAAALGAVIQGRVIGGEQPITGATIQIYAVGNTGNGSVATSLIGSSNTSGTGGTFTISNMNYCPTPSNTPVYLTATGGNPGLSGTVDNTYITLVAALGPCNNLSPSTNIVVNEVTTVAAAWALAPFAASPTSIGASSTNFTGITNAFTLADQLANTATGQSPNPSLPANSIVESAKLNSLADVIASCVSSNGTGGPCSSLFTQVGIAPSDTFSAALAVVKHPGTNVANIYNLGTTTPPFPGLSSAPNDWTMTITYPILTGPLTNFSLYAFDSTGDLWGYTSNNTLTSFSRSSTTFTAGISKPLYPAADGNYYSAGGPPALDASNNVWLLNQVVYPSSGTSTYLENGGSVLEYNSSGTLLSASPGYTSGGILDPQAIALDSNGNAWIGNSGTVPTMSGDTVNGGDVALLNSSGAATSPSTGYQESTTFNPTSVAIDGNHTAWFSNYEYNTNCLSCGYVTSITTPSSGSPTITKITIPDQYAYSVAVGTGNNVWFTSAPPNSGGTAAGHTKHLGEISSGSLVTDAITGGGLTDAYSMQVDPSNNIWIAGYNVLSPTYVGSNPFYPLMLSEFNSSGTAVSPAPGGNNTYGGYGSDNNLTVRSFYPLLNDSSGSLWVSGTSYLYNGNTAEIDGITVFVGLATPVKIPQTGPPVAP